MTELVPGSGPQLPAVSGANPVVIEAKAADPSREVRQGLFIAFLFFVVFLGWAALVPLDAGAFAHGEVEVSGSRQAVQYREGGVVSALRVHEGDLVQQGQVLVEISADELRATERSLTAEVLLLEAQKARLEAERDGRADLIPPPDFAALSPQDLPIAQDALRLQRQQMVARRQALSSKRAVLNQRTAQLNQQIEGLNRQMSANGEQQSLIADELKGVQELAAKGYAPQTRIRALERAAADLRGTSGAQSAQAAEAREAIGQTQMEAIGLERGQTEEVMDTLRQTELQLGDLRPKLMAARDQLARAMVRAPATGRVVGLTVFTVGGVVQPGQTLMEVVPSHAELIIKARFSPNDADDLYPGQKTEIRIPAFHQRNMPIINGRLAEVSADALVELKSASREMLQLLAAAVHARISILVSGGTGAGKTTFLNMLSQYIPDTQRLVTIEDAAELQLAQENIVRLETRPPNVEGQGAIRQRQLLINCLRMRPDRIIIGEVRGEEAFDMLQAMNTGHEGSMTTIHANSPRDALSRLESMVLMGNFNLPERTLRHQISSAIGIVVQCSRLSDGTRKVTSISEITGMDENIISMQEIFSFQRKGIGSAGNVVGAFRPSGIRPKFMDRLRIAGIQLPSSLFETTLEIA